MTSFLASILSNGKYNQLIFRLYQGALSLLGIFIVYLVAVNFNFLWLFGKMPGIEDLDNPKSEIASEIISSDGKVIGKFFFENRSPVDFEEISPNIINALIATEDVRFTKHSGIDARSMFRVLGGVLTLSPKGGGSTISQQLAKNLFKLRNDDAYEGPMYYIPGLRTLLIKTKEWITAVKLERRYTKKEIMKMYLDTIEFSNGAYGIKSAAKTYFSKSPALVTVPEAALLVGMIQNPSRFNPRVRPENATIRRNTVLNQMVKYEKITLEEAEKYQKEPIALDYSPESHNSGLAPYFREYLKNWLKGQLKTAGYSEDDLYTKGFKIYTTIDSRMQAYAEEAMQEHMRDQQKKFYQHWKGRNPWVGEVGNTGRYAEIPKFIEKMAKRTGYYQELKREFGDNETEIMAAMNKKMPMRVFTWEGERDTLMSHMDSLRHYKRFLNMGMLAMDPRNGHIKAWVGGINYKYFKYDHVAQGSRQPGSTFKPFVYVAAIDNGFSTCDAVTDQPVTFGEEDGVYGAPYTPKNSDGKFSYRRLSLRDALGQSVNSVSAYLIKQFKPETVIKYAHQLGIKSELPNSPSLCLGVGEVTLFEMVASYGVFANGGKYTEPIFVTRIEDKNGEIIQQYLPDQKEVLSQETAYKMVHLMRGATSAGGTSLGLSRYGVLDGNEVAAKTGTTSNYSDGWFMGMTHNLVGGVWAGGDDRAIHFRTIDLGQGARMAMPAWGLFMKKVYSDPDIEYKKGKFTIPPTVTIRGACVTAAGENYYSDSTKIYTPPSLVPPDDDELL